MTKSMAMVALVAMLAVGCGDDDTTSSTAEATVQPEQTGDAGVDTASADESSDTASTDTAAQAGDALPGACGFATFIEDSESVLDSLFDPWAEVDREAIAAEFLDGLDEWATRMPDEIADEFAVLASGSEAVFGALAANDWDFEAALADPATQEAFALSDTDEFTAASDALDVWFLDNCGIDISDDDDGSDDGDADGDDGALDALRLPFDPCAVPATVDLTGLVEVDFDEGSSSSGTFWGDAVVTESCGWYDDDFSLLSISSIAFTDADAAAADLRGTAQLFGGEIEDLSDRYAAPAFASVFDTLVTVYVFGGDVPLGVSYTRTDPDDGPVPDVATTHAIAELLLAELEPLPGGFAPTEARDQGPVDPPVDAEPFDSSTAVYAFDACEAVASSAVTDLIDTGGTTTSSGGGAGSYQSNELCSARGTGPDGRTVDVTVLAVAFDDEAAARSDLISGSDGERETTVDIGGLPPGTFVTADDFWGDTVWVLGTDTPFGVRVVVADSDPQENDQATAVLVAEALVAAGP